MAGRADTVLFSQPERAVHVRLGDRPARIGLEGELLQFPDAPEAPQQRLEPARIRATGERRIEPVLTLEHARRPGEAGAGQARGDHAAVCRPAGVKALGPRAIGEVLDDPAGLTAADAEGMDQLDLGQPHELARRGGGAEAPRDGGGVKVARVQRAGDGEADTAHHFDPGDEGF